MASSASWGAGIRGLISSRRRRLGTCGLSGTSGWWASSPGFQWSRCRFTRASRDRPLQGKVPGRCHASVLLGGSAPRAAHHRLQPLSREVRPALLRLGDRSRASPTDHHALVHPKPRLVLFGGSGGASLVWRVGPRSHQGWRCLRGPGSRDGRSRCQGITPASSHHLRSRQAPVQLGLVPIEPDGDGADHGGAQVPREPGVRTWVTPVQPASGEVVVAHRGSALRFHRGSAGGRRARSGGRGTSARSDSRCAGRGAQTGACKQPSAPAALPHTSQVRACG